MPSTCPPPSLDSFEEEVLNRTSCEVHTFDCTYEKGASIHERHSFHKVRMHIYGCVLGGYHGGGRAACHFVPQSCNVQQMYPLLLPQSM